MENLGALITLSVITAYLAQIINKTYENVNYLENSNIINCQIADDKYQNEKSQEVFNLEFKSEVVIEKIIKRKKK